MDKTLRMAKVRLQSVTKRFGETVVVDNVTLDIHPGDRRSFQNGHCAKVSRP